MFRGFLSFFFLFSSLFANGIPKTSGFVVCTDQGFSFINPDYNTLTSAPSKEIYQLIVSSDNSSIIMESSEIKDSIDVSKDGNSVTLDGKIPYKFSHLLAIDESQSLVYVLTDKAIYSIDYSSTLSNPSTIYEWVDQYPKGIAFYNDTLYASFETKNSDKGVFSWDGSSWTLAQDMIPGDLLSFESSLFGASDSSSFQVGIIGQTIPNTPGSAYVLASNSTDVYLSGNQGQIFSITGIFKVTNSSPASTITSPESFGTPTYLAANDQYLCSYFPNVKKIGIYDLTKKIWSGIIPFSGQVNWIEKLSIPFVPPIEAICYVTDAGDSTVKSIDLATGDIIRTYPVSNQGMNPTQIAVSPEGLYACIFYTTKGAASVSVLNLASGSESVVGSSFTPISNPNPLGHQVATDPLGNYAYVLTQQSLWMINLSEASVTTYDYPDFLPEGFIPSCLCCSASNNLTAVSIGFTNRDTNNSAITYFIPKTHTFTEGFSYLNGVIIQDLNFNFVDQTLFGVDMDKKIIFHIGTSSQSGIWALSDSSKEESYFLDSIAIATDLQNNPELIHLENAKITLPQDSGTQKPYQILCSPDLTKLYILSQESDGANSQWLFVMDTKTHEILNHFELTGLQCDTRNHLLAVNSTGDCFALTQSAIYYIQGSTLTTFFDFSTQTYTPQAIAIDASDLLFCSYIDVSSNSHIAQVEPSNLIDIYPQNSDNQTLTSVGDLVITDLGYAFAIDRDTNSLFSINTNEPSIQYTSSSYTQLNTLCKQNVLGGCTGIDNSNNILLEFNPALSAISEFVFDHDIGPIFYDELENLGNAYAIASPTYGQVYAGEPSSLLSIDIISPIWLTVGPTLPCIYLDLKPTVASTVYDDLGLVSCQQDQETLLVSEGGLTFKNNNPYGVAMIKTDVGIAGTSANSDPNDPYITSFFSRDGFLSWRIDSQFNNPTWVAFAPKNIKPLPTLLDAFIKFSPIKTQKGFFP